MKKKPMPAHIKVARLLKLLGWGSAIIGTPNALLCLYGMATGRGVNRPAAEYVSIFVFLACTCIAAGISVGNHSEGGRKGGMVLGVLFLLSYEMVPILAIAGLYIVWMLGQHWELKTPEKSDSPAG
jgi:hypothetical protein